MKILVITKNWLGDVLFEVPALEALRENFPASDITVLAPPRCREILEALPFINRVKAFDERGEERSLGAKLRFIFWLWQEKFDRVFLFHRSATRAFLTWLGGVRERIGYAAPKRDWLLTTAIRRPEKALHQVDYFLVMLKGCGLKVHFGAEYRFFFSAGDEKEAVRLLQLEGLKEKSFAAFHIGANWDPKRWPSGHFARLADLLAEKCSLPVVLTGSKRDGVTASGIFGKMVKARRLSLCGMTSLKVLAALFQKAAFVVSSDSGPMHIASGVGTPVVALFGPTCPRLTGPRGTGKKIVIQYVPEGYSVPWRGKDFPQGGWMEKIKPETVLEKIVEEKLWSPRENSVSSL